MAHLIETVIYGFNLPLAFGPQTGWGGAGVKKNCVELRSATRAFFGPAATLLCSPFAGSLSLTLLLRPEGSVAELIAGKILLLVPPCPF